MDAADAANDHIEREMMAALAARRPGDPQATGQCLFCDEPVGPGLRFCGPDCRDGFDAEQQALKRSGMAASGPRSAIMGAR